MAEQEDVLRSLLDVVVLQPSRLVFIQSYQHEVLDKCKNGELALKRLASQVLAQSFRSQYRSSEKHLHALLADVYKHVPTFAEVFGRVLLAKCPTLVASFAGARVIALRLSCTVLDAALTSKTEATGAWLLQLLASQSRLLEATIKDFERFQRQARKALLTLLKKHDKTLLPMYVDVITTAPPEEQHYQLWLILSQSHLLEKETQELLWTRYTFWAFESKKRSFVSLYKADNRFKTLQYEDFEQGILPTMAKMLKKAPDTVIEAVVAFVQAAPLDFGRYLSQVFQSVLIAKLRAPKDDVRTLAIALGHALARSFRQCDHMQQFVVLLSAVLDGKHGLLAQFYQREATFAVLKDAADAVTMQFNASEVQDMALMVIASLLKAVGKEAQEQTRHLGLLALGKWLALAGTDELDAATVTALKNGLKDKREAVVAGYLRALAVLCRSRATAAVAFADEIIAVITDSNKKPNVCHLDGVLAIAVAGAIASASSEMDARMAKEGVHELLLSPTSFVETSVRAALSTVASTCRQGSLPETPEASALIALSPALVWVLASQQSDASEAYLLLVELLCSSDLAVRQSAEDAVKAIYLSSLEHCTGLVAAFEKKIDALSAEEKTMIPPAGVLRRVLRVLVPAAIREANDIKVSIFASTLFLAHHPFLVAGKKVKAFAREWQSIRCRFVVPSSDATKDKEDDDSPSEADLVDNFIEEHSEVKTALVELFANVSTGKLYSTSPLQRLAAQRAMATLLEFAGNGDGEDLVLHDIIEDSLAKRLDDEGIDALSDEDVAICQTPFDELYEPKKDGDAEESTNCSNRGGRRGNEDEQWEQQQREELERKKRAEQRDQKKEYTKEQVALLKQQQQVRRKVQEIRRVVSAVLETVAMLAHSRPEELHPTLPYLLRSVRVLFTCPLFNSEASEALVAMAKAVCPKALRANYQDIGSALRIAMELNQVTSEKAKIAHVADMETLLLRLLTELMDFVFGFQFESETDFDAESPCNLLSPPTLHLIFPVLRALLHYAPDLRRWALPLFAVHARMISAEEEEEVGDVAAQRLLRREMMELTLTLLAQQARGSALPISNPDLTPGKVLTCLCMGPELTASEWAPLLGDDGLLSDEANARNAILTALLNVVQSDEEGEEFRTAKPSSLLISRLYCCCFDTEEKNRVLAKHVWDATGATVTALFAGPLLGLLNHSHASVRESASLALADGMRKFPQTVTPLLKNLKAQFLKSQPKPVEQKDEFGIPSVRRPGAQAAEVDEDSSTLCPRLGVALCLEKAAVVAGPDAMSSENTMSLLTFVMEHGLGDPNSKVRAQMRITGVQAVASLGGGANTTPLLEMFEHFLETTAPPAASTIKGSSSGKKPKVGTHLAAQEEEMQQQRKQALTIYDHQREGVVVCLGSLAKHMAPTDPKVSFIVDSLLEALDIPSESVQRSVAACLSPLMGVVKDRSASILDDLLKRVTESETFGERMGAAYGISAVVKGLGISALKVHKIIPRLEDEMKTGGANARQGAMLVFECLSQRLGLLFEPYIIVILPIMLKCSADTSPQVREAASHTAKGIMANLSAHGVKLVLPSLLGALEESAWRTKQSGIQILGSMAYCAPRQLGSCLPQVVPKLMAALTDSHPKVREAGKSALRDVGSVVRNPEIATISHVLLDALEEPNRHTAEALQQLQSTSFQHSIDAPSLALVMPIITRGLKDRAGDAKKKAALIVGSMCSMINDAKDLIPYMETVLPSLKTQLMDPIPEVRAVAAKALGKLVKGLGERHFADMLTWLLEAMKNDEVGPVERSGAAQGLCEVVVALGIDRVESVMRDDIMPLARHPKYSVREGVLWVMAFLPPALGKQFAMFLREALPIVVAGLSDEAESVRDVAMHSGHVVVNAHALTHTRELLPSLEAGLFDDSWRIRQSSVMLLGDLMYRISGTRVVAVATPDNNDDDDETSGSAAGDRAIIKLLGVQRRNAILASLYMIRSDTSAIVRQSALQVWKSVVANTPKTLRQILETLMNAIVSALSGDNMEKQTMAGRALGEIVRKLGEHVLPEVVPILRAGLSPLLPIGRRQGACVGLAEVIECCTRKQLEDYVDTLVDAVLDGVCDEVAEVRASAAQAFDVLHKGIGYRAIDETVPMVLERIHSCPSAEEQERALLGLQEILRVKPREVLPYLIPRLLVTPMTTSAPRAVSRVAQATGAVIHFQIERIFATFFDEYVKLLGDESSDASTTEFAAEIKSSLRDVVLSVEAPGVHWLAIELCKYCEHDHMLQRALAFELVAEFCSHASVPYDDQAPLFLKQIVLHLNDQHDRVVRAASAALKGMNVTTRPEQFAQHLDFIRQSINSMVSDARHRKGGVGDGEYLLPGLCIPQGLDPFLPSYQWALMNGSPELRQSAAAGLGELVDLSSASALRPYLIKVTGPLIRIAGDRFPGHVKAEILQTLEILLTKGGAALKPFFSQLQTTFVKALNDTAVNVRARGASALSLLVTLSPRVEPLVAELTERLRTTTGGVREANVEALVAVVDRVGDKLSAASRSTLESALEEVLESSEDAVRDGASKCLAACVASAANNDVKAAQKQLLDYSLANVSVDDVQALTWQRRQSAAVFTALVLPKHAALLTSEVVALLVPTLVALAQDEQSGVRNHALKAIGVVVKRQPHAANVAALVPVLVENVAHKNKDVSRGALHVVKVTAKRSPEQTRDHLVVLVPAVFQLIKSNNLAVKLPAERTLLYLLQVHSRPETLTEYLRGGSADAKIIGEYTRRVLSKLKADSGDESD